MSNVAQLVRQARAMLLDFDGPVCRLFAGYPATQIADQMRTVLNLTGESLPTGPNPLQILRWVAENRPEHVPQAETLLTGAEVTAASSAAPTDYAGAMLANAKSLGLPVAIVSNNSSQAVRRYLSLHGFTDYVAYVAGRSEFHPERMKPNPEPLFRAASFLRVSVQKCLLVGDSPSDIEAAHRAGAYSIGYAKAPDRVAGLISAKPNSVVHSMEAVASALSMASSA